MKKLKDYLYNNRWNFVWIITVIIVFAPSIKAGICLVDEVELRLNNVKGYWHACKIFIEEAQYQGRATNAIPFILFSNLAFRLKTTLFFRSISALIIALSFCMVCRFIYKITENKAYAKFLFLFLLICLPFTMEHTIPNGFVAFLGMPFVLLLFSLNCYIELLKTGKKYLIFLVCLSLFITLCSYEAFIMYTPLYLILTIYYKKKNIVEIIKNLIFPALTGVSYLVIYVVQRFIFPTNYAGNEICFNSVQESATILINLFKTGIPGYFSSTAKYQNVYYSMVKTGLRPSGFGKVRYFLENVMSVRMFVLILIMILLIFLIWNEKEQISRIRNKLGVILVSMMYMFLPSIPISLSSAYQNNVHEGAFMALPVSYYIYIAGCICVTAVLWWVLAERSTALKTGLVLLILFLELIPIQSLNERALYIQRENYKDYLYVEQMLGTNTAQSYLQDKTVYAGDLYSTVAMRRSYLSLITESLYDYKTLFCDKSHQENATVTIIWEKEGFFVLDNGEKRMIISNCPLDVCMIQSSNGNYEIVYAINGNYDNDLLIYEVSDSNE